MNGNDILEEAKRIKSLADIGLLYTTNDFDRERYEELLQISKRLIGGLGGVSAEDLQAIFSPVVDYPTAKVDVRVLVLSPDNKILMVREMSDGGWSLPGGWAEIGFTPAETAVKECREETGLDVVPKKLLAIFDKRKHPHPSQALYIYKLVIYCEAVNDTFQKAHDVLDVGYFSIDALPPLSEERIVRQQIETVYRKVVDGDDSAYFD